MKSDEGIIYCHIPKCGGTSLHKVIRQQLLNGDYIQTPKANSEKKTYRGVGGHFRLGKHPSHIIREDVNYHTVTLLRNPIERVASFYRYVVSGRHPHYLRDLAVKCGQDMLTFSLYDFMHFCIDHENTEISNLQVKYLCGNDQMLSSIDAFSALQDRVEVWGTCENMAKFYRQLGDRFDISINEEKENVTKSNELRSSERSLIEKYNELDMDLWEKINPP